MWADKGAQLPTPARFIEHPDRTAAVAPAEPRPPRKPATPAEQIAFFNRLEGR